MEIKKELEEDLLAQEHELLSASNYYKNRESKTTLLRSQLFQELVLSYENQSPAYKYYPKIDSLPADSVPTLLIYTMKNKTEISIKKYLKNIQNLKFSSISINGARTGSDLCFHLIQSPCLRLFCQGLEEVAFQRCVFTNSSFNKLFPCLNKVKEVSFRNCTFQITHLKPISEKITFSMKELSFEGCLDRSNSVIKYDDLEFTLLLNLATSNSVKKSLTSLTFLIIFTAADFVHLNSLNLELGGTKLLVRDIF
ncbi:unnamed protein product [Moneuplotes crassus]|uniref:Uncharacterized protein n=1 Tax=Euplotes crassus TaxID=5936 RepID=A0AAD1XT34_EUPCR|nr:unnamed protein product [Moneuplotes crassus]